MAAINQNHRAADQRRADTRLCSRERPSDCKPLILIKASSRGGVGWGLRNQPSSNQRRKPNEILHQKAQALLQNRPSCLIHVHLRPWRRGETSSPQELRSLTGGLPQTHRALPGRCRRRGRQVRLVRLRLAASHIEKRVSNRLFFVFYKTSYDLFAEVLTPKYKLDIILRFHALPSYLGLVFIGNLLVFPFRAGRIITVV
jgi:hypothetical protein